MTKTRKTSRAGPGKRVWLAVGGLVGLIALIGVVLQAAGLLQTSNISQSQDAAQNTMIAIMNAQLAVQRQIATFQASGVSAGPTATAIAGKIVQLQNTQAALEVERLKIEATLTVGPPRPTGPIPTPGSFGPVNSQVAGISAELLEFSRFENTITVKLRFNNSGQENQSLWLTHGSYLLDEATQKRYSSTQESNGLTSDIASGSSFEVWAKYSIPEEEKPKFLTLVLPNGVLFEHVEVR